MNTRLSLSFVIAPMLMMFFSIEARSASDQTLITEESVKAVQKIINYDFKDKSLLRSALIHSSRAANEEDYKNLEFRGDRFIGSIVTEQMPRFPTSGERQDYFTSKTNNGYLGERYKLLGLNRYFLYQSGSTPEGTDVYGGALEALVAAIMLDHTEKKHPQLKDTGRGFKFLTPIVIKMVLNDITPQRSTEPPVVSILSHSTTKIKQTVTLKDRNGRVLATKTARGKTKKEAEDNAKKSMAMDVWPTLNLPKKKLTLKKIEDDCKAKGYSIFTEN